MTMRSWSRIAVCFLLTGLLAVAPGLARPARASPSAAASVDTLAKTGISPSALSLLWAETTDLCFLGYDLEYSTASLAGPWISLATINASTSTSEYIFNLHPAATYWWQIVDTDCTGATADSNVLQVTQPGVATLTANLVGPTSVAFNWTNPATYAGLVGFGNYEIVGSTGGTWTVMGAPITVEPTQFTILSGLTPGANWTFAVVTTDECSNCYGGTYSTSSTSNPVSIATPAPLRATLQGSPASAEMILQPVAFTCTATGGESPLNYTWSFGDGSHATTANGTTSHVYRTPGSYAATCTVTDSFGQQATASSTEAVSMWWVIGVVVAGVAAVAVAVLLLRRRRKSQAAPPPGLAPPATITAPPQPAPESPPLPPPPGLPPGPPPAAP